MLDDVSRWCYFHTLSTSGNQTQYKIKEAYKKSRPFHIAESITNNKPRRYMNKLYVSISKYLSIISIYTRKEYITKKRTTRSSPISISASHHRSSLSRPPITHIAHSLDSKNIYLSITTIYVSIYDLHITTIYV